MPLIKPVIRNGIIVVGLASTLFFAHTTQAVWNGQPYTPGSTLNPECSPAQINCTVAPYTLQNITDQGYTTNRPIRVNGVSTTANILPTSNNLYDLGDVSNYWHRLFANNVSSTDIDAYGYVSTTALWVNGSPVTSNVPTLQQVTNQGYFTTHPIGFTGASSTGNIIPTDNGLFDLGSSSYIWKKIFVKNASSTALDVLTYVSTTNIYALGNVGIGTGSPTVQLTQKTTAVNESAPLGAEMTDATGWTSTDWTGDYNAGFTHTTGNTTPLSRTMTTTINQTYQVSFTVTGRTAGTFTVSIGGVTGDELFYYSNSFGPRATSTNGSLIFTPTSNFNGTISNISVKLVTGSYGASYSILDNTGAANFEIRSSESSLENHYLGVGAGGYNTTGFGNTANGVQALSRNTSGYYNSANGSYTLASNRSGRYNTAEGVFSLYSNTTGVGNTAIGGESMPSNTSGAYNSSLGLRSLYNNSTGYNNTADGTFALYANTTGYYNSALGSWALYANTSGFHNTALGLDSLSNITTGYDNIGIGYKAGRYIADGETDNQTSVNSIYIGSNTRPLANGNTNEIVIGTTAIGIGSNSVVLGDNNITKTALKGNVGIGTTNPYLFKLTIAGSIAPSTTNSYDLGGTANYWRKLFVKNVSSTNIDALGYVSSSKLFVNGTQILSANPNLQQVTDQGYFTTRAIGFAGASSTGNIIPTTNNLYSLGSATQRWKFGYFGSGVYSSNTIMVENATGGYGLNASSTNGIGVAGYGSGPTGAGAYFASRGGYVGAYVVQNNVNALTATSTSPALWAYRSGTYDYPSHDYTGPVLMVEDNRAWTGDLQQWKKQGSVKLRVDNTGTLKPAANNSLDLGSTTLAFRSIYVSSTSYLAGVNAGGNVIPRTTLTYDLGSSSNYWRKLFVNNVSSTNVDADGYISAAKLLINGTEVVTANPNLQQVTDQGAITNKWIRFAGATSTGSINPSITNLYDLGSNTNAWRGIYASTSLNVGSSSFKVDQNGAAIGDGTINNKLSINQLNSNNALLKLSSSALTPGLSYAAAIDFYSNYPGTTATFNFSKIYTRSDCGLWICGRLTLSVRDNNGDLMDGLTLKGSPNEAGKIDVGIGTNNPYLYRLTVAGTVAPSTTNSYDLGSNEHAWRSIYASSTIYSAQAGGPNLSFATSGYIYANATDLNSAAFVFQNKSTGAGALFAIADNLNNHPLLINNDNNTFFGWIPSISGSNRVIIAGNGNRADGDLGFAATSTDNSTFYRWSIGVDKSDAGKFKISSSTALGTNDRLTIDGNGNVGIGTSNPSNFKLQIAGNIGPDANLTYDLGSSANRWKDLYVSSTHIGTSTWDLWQANTGFTISRGLENQYITVSNNGNLGIGTTIPDQGRVEVKGDTVCVDTNNDGNASSCITSESDARLKKNTLEIDGALNKIMQLTGVTYDWKTDDPEVLKHYPLISRFKGHEHTVGLIAQDVQKIFPEALSLETVGDKDVQYYQLDYTKFTPLIIEAIKEQQDQINSLKESQALFTNSSPLGPTQPVIESQAGQAKFLLSQDIIPVIFKMAFNDIPVVTVTPMDKIEGPYWIEKVSATGFEIHLAFAQPKDVIFNWQALYNNNQSFPDYINPPPDYTPAPDPSPTVTTTTPAPIPTTTSTPPEPVSVPVTTTQDQATSTSN